MLVLGRKRTGDTWSGLLLAGGSQTIPDPASRWLVHNWLSAAETVESAEGVCAESALCVTRLWKFWFGNWNADGWFTARSNSGLLFVSAGLTLQPRLTYTQLLERKRKERKTPKGSFLCSCSECAGQIVVPEMQHGVPWQPSGCWADSVALTLAGYTDAHSSHCTSQTELTPSGIQPWPSHSQTALSRYFSIDWF